MTAFVVTLQLLELISPLLISGSALKENRLSYWGDALGGISPALVEASHASIHHNVQ